MCWVGVVCCAGWEWCDVLGGSGVMCWVGVVYCTGWEWCDVLGGSGVLCWVGVVYCAGWEWCGAALVILCRQYSVKGRAMHWCM